MPQTARSHGDEFYSLRDYMPGDDIRRIAWRQSARSNKLLVKELEQETARYILFVFDTRVHDIEELEDHFEDAVELIASLAITLLNRQYKVALQTPDHYISEGEGKGHTIAILDFLARVNPVEAEGGSGFNFAQSLDTKRSTNLFVSADPSTWGRAATGARGKVLHPQDVIHA